MDETKRITSVSSWPMAAAIILLPVLAVIGVDRVAHWSQPARRALTHRLKVQPRQGQVYLLGNSMFKTGIDVDLLRARLPRGVVAELAYHDGEYTNLWYLIVRNAILPAPYHPRVLVWGFRPTYAIRPAFRKKQVCDVDRFYVAPDPRFEAIQRAITFTLRERIHLWLAEHSWLFSHRDRIRERLVLRVRSSGLRVLSLAAPRQATDLAQMDRGGETSLADVVLRLLTRGAVQRAEERVVDSGRKRFIYGPNRSFGSSFIPVTAQLLRKGGIKQLVLIFKPVEAIDGRLAAPVRTFHREAVRYLRSEGIPYIDFVGDRRLQRHHFSWGDHYNATGRAIVTETVAAKLRQLLGRQRTRIE